jgi:hypothetical protein
MTDEKKIRWGSHLDSLCSVAGGLLPLGLVIGNTAFELIIALVGLLWMIRCVLMKSNPIPQLLKHPVVIPWLAWLASVFISLLWNGPGGKGWGHDIALVRYLFYVAALIDLSGRRPVFKYLLVGMAAGILWGLFNTILAYLIGHDVFGRPLLRYSFKVKDASRIASIAAYAGPFFLGWGAAARNMTVKRRMCLLLIGLIAMFQVFHIHIRTVEIAAVAGVMAFSLYVVKRYAGLLPAFLLLVMMCVSIWGFAKFGPRVNLASTYYRISYWKVAWEMWKGKPLLGVSVSAWQESYRETAASGKVKAFISPDGRRWKQEDVNHAPSLFFPIFSCTGILGLSAFCWLFINMMRLVIKKRELCGHALLTWPVVFMVIGLTGWNIYGAQYQTIFAYFAALTGVQVDADSKSNE